MQGPMNIKNGPECQICCRHTSCNTLFVPHNLPYIPSSWYPCHYI